MFFHCNQVATCTFGNRQSPQRFRICTARIVPGPNCSDLSWLNMHIMLDVRLEFLGGRMCSRSLQADKSAVDRTEFVWQELRNCTDFLDLLIRCPFPQFGSPYPEQSSDTGGKHWPLASVGWTRPCERIRWALCSDGKPLCWFDHPDTLSQICPCGCRQRLCHSLIIVSSK